LTKEKHSTKGPAFVLPKDALKKADLGASFAEYDLIRNHPELFVETSAMRAAMSIDNEVNFCRKKGYR
jgi:hypothetical protein